MSAETRRIQKWIALTATLTGTCHAFLNLLTVEEVVACLQLTVRRMAKKGEIATTAVALAAVSDLNADELVVLKKAITDRLERKDGQATPAT